MTMKSKKGFKKPKPKALTHRLHNVCIILLGELAVAQAILPITIHFSVLWYVISRMSVLCHIRAYCLNRSTDLRGKGKERFGGRG